MAVKKRFKKSRFIGALMLVLCLSIPNNAVAGHLRDDSTVCIDDIPFSILILGDSQMAGAGWEGGYANCIEETYKNAEVLNLAQNGSLLSNGDIQKQWAFYVSNDFIMPDFVLLDGGINDLSHIRKEDFDRTQLADVYESFRSLIEQIHEAGPDIHIIYFTMPPLKEWKDSEQGPPMYDIQDLYWKYMNILALEYDYVTVVDLFSLNPFNFPCSECYVEYYVDSIHLSEKGYRESFKYIENIFLARLSTGIFE